MLQSITLPASIVKIGRHSFADSGVKQINAPANVRDMLRNMVTNAVLADLP